ncbi:hypothetical protein, partial [Nostoc sp. UHCC 0252]|uniref:hypothetical protein n=1 Tax=Nostoc sp. UHCC 0252 TaxID=3110241 RepID=UPI002B1F9DBC
NGVQRLIHEYKRLVREYKRLVHEYQRLITVVFIYLNCTLAFLFVLLHETKNLSVFFQQQAVIKNYELVAITASG